MLEKLRKRIEPYLVVAVAIGGVWWTGKGIENKVSLNSRAIQEISRDQVQVSETQTLLLDQALSPVVTSQKRLEDKLEIVESNVNGISIAATEGAAARDRLLSGKITAVQQSIVEVKNTQEAFIDTLSTVQDELDDIQEQLAHVDTVIVVRHDTLTAPEKRHILNPVGWIFGRDKEE